MHDLHTLLLSPKGRLDRQNFWIMSCGLVVAGLVAGMLPVVGQAAGLLLLWPWTCVSAKRLHDMDRSAGWVAVPMVPAALVSVLALAAAVMPISIAATGVMLTLAAMAVSLGGVAMLVCLAFLVWIGLTPGVSADNRFGAPARPLLAS